MYQGWFCFGGTEIINNERTRGYAESASQLFDFRQITKPYVNERFVADNLFTNPGFRNTTGPVEVRRNYETAPGGQSWAANVGTATNETAGGPLDGPATFRRAVSGGGGGRVGFYRSHSAVGFAVGEVLTMSRWVRVSQAREVEVGFEFSGAPNSVTFVNVPANVWTRVSHTATVPVGATGVVSIAYVMNTSAGDVIDQTGNMVEKSPVLGPYFDGSTQPKVYDYTPGDPIPQGHAVSGDGTYLYDADFEVSWTGAVNASPSVLTGQAVAGVTSTNSLAIQSTHFLGAQGGKSMRLIPSSGVNNSFAYLPGPGMPLVGTLVGTIHLEDPLSGALSGNALSLLATPPNSRAGVPNSPGSTPLHLDYTLTSISANSIRLYNGASQGNGDVWWTDVGLFVGAPITLGPNAEREIYDGPYFDKYSTPPEGHRIYADWSGDGTSALFTLPEPEEYAAYCDINWFKDDDNRCEFLWEALSIPVGQVFQSGDWEDPSPYEARYIMEDAPWASLTPGGFNGAQMGHDFLGAYAIDVRGLSDTIRDIHTVEGITDGGIIGRSRRAVPSLRFRVMLLAVNESGLEYGTTWLARSLDEAVCATHGPSCGSVDLTFFESCPKPGNPHGPRWIALDALQRFYHDVKCVDGPIVIEEIRLPKQNIHARIVEFTLQAGNPHLYSGDPMWNWIPTQGSTIVNDIPRNAIPFPSAEIAAEDEMAMVTNFATNPSVETSATGWAGVQSVIPAGQITSGRVDGELAAVGTASYRRVFTATGSGSAGWFGSQLQVSASESTPVSLTMWAAAVAFSGTPSLGLIEFEAVWQGSGGATLRTDAMGTAPAAGGAATLRGVTPPAGTDRVQVRAKLNVSSWASGNVIRLYADAVGVMFP